jgi:hypothetical protein
MLTETHLKMLNDPKCIIAFPVAFKFKDAMHITTLIGSCESQVIVANSIKDGIASINAGSSYSEIIDIPATASLYGEEYGVEVVKLEDVLALGSLEA